MCFFFLSRRRHRRFDCDWSSDVCFSYSSRRRHTRFDCDWSSDVCSFYLSRRRHTRFDCDWSSDVCSSDLSRRRHTRFDCDWSSDVCSSDRSEEHTSELQSQSNLVCRLLLGVQTCALPLDRKITRLNSSHSQISYAVFCLKKKKKNVLNSRV